MRNLIAFLIKNGAWFFFILLELVCFYLIFQFNSYQHSLYLNSSNEIAGRVYSVSGNVQSYFGLRRENQQLWAQNAELQQRVWYLQELMNTVTNDSINTNNAFIGDSAAYGKYNFIIARVIGNSVTKANNFITINKGTKAGIEAEMGVISEQGVVGIVREVSSNFAVIQPILNSKSFISCKIKNSNTPGTLIWDGVDYKYAELEGFPRHEKFAIGDSIITSGFSNIFPEGIFVGTVKDSEKESDDNFLTLKVTLGTDFATLSNVIVISNNQRKERIELEKKLEGKPKK
ncbi:rod shape-determining protein MreC [Dysgonomonas sp. 520]|uniref:rod shape-determining protein MreC n=1 Tax=Dysgonomonas sp. 520 TaxID=2302931 RepID=UPI0013D5C569|nr:rod shape-determining protein MreC [Dysgonomonas sp. 520]NDW09388.1 rod shape-determining protein MreC [Dysgonomonas sp. 520]